MGKKKTSDADDKKEKKGNFMTRTNTAFGQQRLRSWQPILIPKTVLPTLFVIGLIFIPIGIGLYIVTSHVKETTIDYTNCASAPSTLTTVGDDRHPLLAWSYATTTRTCTLEFEIPEDYESPVFMYYELTNFYQNHRRYVKSLDLSQLKGDKVATGSLDSNCSPLKGALNIAGSTYGNTVTINGQQVEIDQDAQVYPCGLIANSMFSDDIDLGITCVEGGCTDFSFTDKGIALSTEKDKFKPTQWNDTLKGDALTKFLIPPPMWRDAWNDKWGGGYTNENLPNIQTMERFQVWMRNAALPNFRKLWGRNDNSKLTKGIYRVNVVNNFDSAKYKGTKSLVFSTISALGGRNPFLGITYIAIGGTCWVIGFIFLIRHVVRPRKLGDYSYLSWNQQQAEPTM